MHQRQAIRAAAVTLLKNAATNAGQRVVANRAFPHWQSELPAVVVWIRSESTREFSVAPRELERKLNLVVSGVVEQQGEGDNLDDRLDDLAEQIENALLKKDTLNGTAADVILVNTDMSVEEEGERVLGFVDLSFDVTYFLQAPVTAVIDDFEKANFTIEEPDGGKIEGKATVPGATP